MTNSSLPTARALLLGAAESHDPAARAFAAASAAPNSLSASAASAQVAIDAASNTFIRAEVTLNRAAEALEENED